MMRESDFRDIDVRLAYDTDMGHLMELWTAGGILISREQGLANTVQVHSRVPKIKGEVAINRFGDVPKADVLHDLVPRHLHLGFEEVQQSAKLCPVLPEQPEVCRCLEPLLAFRSYDCDLSPFWGQGNNLWPDRLQAIDDAPGRIVPGKVRRLQSDSTPLLRAFAPAL